MVGSAGQAEGDGSWDRGQCAWPCLYGSNDLCRLVGAARPRGLLPLSLSPQTVGLARPGLCLAVLPQQTTCPHGQGSPSPPRPLPPTRLPAAGPPEQA